MASQFQHHGSYQSDMQAVKKEVRLLVDNAIAHAVDTNDPQIIVDRLAAKMSQMQLAMIAEHIKEHRAALIDYVASHLN